MRRGLGAAVLAAAVAASAVVAFVVARSEDGRDDPPRTSSTSLAPAEPPADEVAAAVTAALQQRLAVPLDAEQAACITAGLLDHLAPDDLVELARDRTAVVSVAPALRDGLVAVVVRCVPEPVAAALLSGSTTTSTATDLPGQVDG